MGGVRAACWAGVVILLVALIPAHTSQGSSPVSPNMIPCPRIMASSPQTLSTEPPPSIQCPGVLVGTYFGGASFDWAMDVVSDPDGNSYVVGYTNSTDFPRTLSARAASSNGDYDAFLATFAPNGALLYSTSFGGSLRDSANAVTLDASGNVYVAGSTNSSDFPATPGALHPTHKGGGTDAFLAKFDSAGALTYATFLGGTGPDSASSVEVDSFGNVYLMGTTRSADFPVTPEAYDSGDIVSRDGIKNSFVAKLDLEGHALVYSAVVGGRGWDEPFDLAIDAAGAAYVVGYTESGDFPITVDAFDGTLNGLGDAFAFKLEPDGGVLGYSTFLGGSGGWCEDADALVLDDTGTAYITGSACSYDFPTTPGAGGYSGGEDDAYLLILGPSGTVRYATLFGGSGMDEGNAIFRDASDQLYLTGYTESHDFPTTKGSFDATYNGQRDSFVAKFDPTVRTFTYSTYLGGGDNVLFGESIWVYNVPCNASCGDLGLSLTVDADGNATVVGFTNSLDFPTTDGAYNTRFEGGMDAFVVRIDFLPEPNRAPVAYFEAPSATNSLRIGVDASDSADAEDRTSLLEVRWDWEDDGVWDTAWSPTKVARHEFAWAGTYRIRLEARDTDGLVNDATREVAVGDLVSGANGAVGVPPWIAYASPTAIATGATIILLVRWRRKLTQSL